ncbi:HPP family protein [Paracoccus aminophilus]|uniref:HPP family protein n=1 Tax=Paracoccus aminophilus JCM 7686 TaxID=1367847 RepID=S5YCK3_PARAH|nr:HPP family protein [Paracoccus aminophilus]AGT09168.1 HPP family protein [Paracoccus aminophilus JCM 7686]
MTSAPSDTSAPLTASWRLRVIRALQPALTAGFGGMLAIWAIAELDLNVTQLLLIAPFGASSVLLFALPKSPLARARNVIGGHVISATMGLIVLTLLGNSPLSCGLGVGLAIAAMVLTDTVHPPAGGNPIIVILTGASWQFLLTPILAGAVLLFAMATLYRLAVSKLTGS